MRRFPIAVKLTQPHPTRQKRASNSSVAMHKYTVYKALGGSRRVVSDVADPRITARGPAVLRPIYIGAERAW